MLDPNYKNTSESGFRCRARMLEEHGLTLKPRIEDSISCVRNMVGIRRVVGAFAKWMRHLARDEEALLGDAGYRGRSWS